MKFFIELYQTVNRFIHTVHDLTEQDLLFGHYNHNHRLELTRHRANHNFTVFGI